MLSPKQAAQPNPSYPRPLSSGHHISMEHRLRRKQLNSDTNASKKSIWKKYKKKEKKKLFLRRNEGRKWKTLKNQKGRNEQKMRKMKNKKQEKDKKTGGKKGKEGPKKYHPRWAQKLIFNIRTVKRNRNEIEAQKIRFWAPNKDKENEGKWRKMKEKWKKNERNERKWKKMKENEGKWKKMKENERKWRKMKENEGKKKM